MTASKKAVSRYAQSGDAGSPSNIGAKLQIDQANADKQIAQAKAEERRAMAVALEQEMQARVVDARVHRGRRQGRANTARPVVSPRLVHGALSMSVETLVLLALLIVLPLIQQMIRTTRQRNQRPPEPTEVRPPAAPARTRPPEVTVPPLLEAIPRAPSDGASASTAVPAPDAVRPVAISVTPHRTMGQRSAMGLRTRCDLRRAIMLVAILGPCRASSPYRSACDERTP